MSAKRVVVGAAVMLVMGAGAVSAQQPSGGAAQTPDSVWVRAITAGRGRMPACGSRLQPAQVRALVTYLKTFHRR